MMQDFQQVVVGGVKWRTATPGSFFRLVSGSGVLVQFFLKGALVGEANNVDAGFWKENAPFDAVELTATVSQTIKIVIADGHVGLDASPVVNGGATPINLSYSTLGGTGDYLDIAPNAKRLTLKARGNNSGVILFSFVGDPATSGNYFELYAGDSFSESLISVGPAGLRLYLGGAASQTLDVLYWV